MYNSFVNYARSHNFHPQSYYIQREKQHTPLCALGNTKYKQYNNHMLIEMMITHLG